MMASHSCSNEIPAACAAIGSSEVSVMPGDTFTSRTYGAPVVGNQDVDASDVPGCPAPSIAARRCPSDVVGDDGIQPRGREVVGRPCRIARAVVIDAALRHDLDEREALHRLADEPRGDLGSSDHLLDDRGAAERQRTHNRAGEVALTLDGADPQAPNRSSRV